MRSQVGGLLAGVVLGIIVGIAGSYWVGQRMSESIVIAVIGVTGAVIGTIATVAVQLLSHYQQEKAAAKRDKPRKDLLLGMLRAPQYQWRKLDTLMHVIGADEETTKRLLLEVGARASEDGKPLWGLVERNPLPEGKE